MQLHCKYIDHNTLFCLIYHSNLVVTCIADGRIQPMIVPSTTIPWFQPLVVVCQSRFIVDIGIKEKQTLVSKKSIKYNTKQLELQFKIVMFQDGNKYWRAHLERLFGGLKGGSWLLLFKSNIQLLFNKTEFFAQCSLTVKEGFWVIVWKVIVPVNHITQTVEIQLQLSSICLFHLSDSILVLFHKNLIGIFFNPKKMITEKLIPYFSSQFHQARRTLWSVHFTG